VSAAITDLQNAFNDAIDGGVSKTRNMHDKEAVLMKLMYDLANYVISVANGDENIVHLANIETKKRSPGKTSGFTVAQGTDSGTVVVRTKAVARAHYKWQYCADPINNTSWKDAGETSLSKILIAGLNPGTLYWFRVTLFYNNAQHEFSSPISLRVI